MRSSSSAASCSTSCQPVSSRYATSACSPTATVAGHWRSANSISTPPLPTAQSCSPNNSALRLTAPALGANAAPCTSSPRYSALEPATHTSLRNLQLFLSQPCSRPSQFDCSLRWLLTPPAPLYASNRLRAPHDRHQAEQSRVATASLNPPQPWLILACPLVPHQPCRLSAGAIQSPYIHRANGLLQIAVSTLLRTSSVGKTEIPARGALSIRH